MVSSETINRIGKFSIEQLILRIFKDGDFVEKNRTTHGD
jgi:hypothetical protein